MLTSTILTYKRVSKLILISSPLQLVLKNLTSYYNYSISVAACTFACSDKSPPLIAETKVGGKC